MSVRTEADERLDAARSKIRAARKDLLAVLDEETWGHDDFNDEFRLTINDSAQELYVILNKLHGCD
jgi:hypothetical protein